MFRTVSLLLLALLAVVIWESQASAPAPPALPWAVEVVREYCPELADTGVIEDCWTGYDEADTLQIIVVTAQPTLLPTEMDTIPVVTVAPPAAPPGPLASFPKTVDAYRTVCPGLLAAVSVEDCWTGYVGEVLHVVVMTDSPALIPTTLETLPTVIVPPPPAPPPESEPSTSGSSSQGTTPATSSGAGQGSPGSSVSGAQQSEKSPPAPAPLDLGPLLALPGVLGVGREADHLVVETTEPGRVPATFGGLPVRIADLSALLPRSASRDTATSYSFVTTYAYTYKQAPPKSTD